MGNKQIVKRLNKELKEALEKTVIKHEIDKVAEGIMNLFDNSNLTPIEILGILEMIKQTIHRDCICKKCAKKGVDL